MGTQAVGRNCLNTLLERAISSAPARAPAEPVTWTLGCACCVGLSLACGPVVCFTYGVPQPSPIIVTVAFSQGSVAIPSAPCCGSALAPRSPANRNTLNPRCKSLERRAPGPPTRSLVPRFPLATACPPPLGEWEASLMVGIEGDSPKP